MTADNTVSRSLHDLGLATWFGGSLMGAVGLNGAAAEVEEPKQRLRVANAGWNRWTPVNLAGIAAHLAGGAVLLGANKGRVASQQGVTQATVVKTALTGAALGMLRSGRLMAIATDRGLVVLARRIDAEFAEVRLSDAGLPQALQRRLGLAVNIEAARDDRCHGRLLLWRAAG